MEVQSVEAHRTRWPASQRSSPVIERAFHRFPIRCVHESGANPALTNQKQATAQIFEGYTHADDVEGSSLQTYHLDKIPEDKMAELVGTTRRALQGKRARGVIPKGVWNTIDSRIYYSIRRYEAWLESQWDCPPELNLLDSPSAFASPGTGNAVAKPSPIPKRRRGLRLPPTYALT
jgi:hypothetical protein